MTFRFWERWGAAFGLAAVILWIISFAVGGSSPDTSDSPAKITAYFADHGNQVRQIAAFFIFLVGVLASIAFVAAMRARLLAGEGEPGRVTAVAYGAGLTSAILWIVGLASLTAPAFMANDTKASYLDANSFRLVSSLGYELWVCAVIAGAVLVWATSAIALRTGMFPRWFGWVGVVVGVLLLFAIFFIPTFVYWGWIALASGLLAFSRRTSARAPAPMGPA